jgi:hypothetical protein
VRTWNLTTALLSLMDRSNMYDLYSGCIVYKSFLSYQQHFMLLLQSSRLIPLRWLAMGFVCFFHIIFNTQYVIILYHSTLNFLCSDTMSFVCEQSILLQCSVYFQNFT